jgi:hypothetical protein
MKLKIDNVILSMPRLFEASAFDANSDEKFSAHFIVSRGSPQEAQVKEAIVAEATTLWGAKVAPKLKAMAAAGKIWCLRDGDGKVDKQGNPYAGYEGAMYVSAKNTIRPLVIDGNRAPLVAADGKLYAGCIVNAIIDVRVSDKPSDQAYAYLLGVQFVKDGTRMAGGSAAAADDFEAIPEAAAAKAEATKEGAASLF